MTGIASIDGRDKVGWGVVSGSFVAFVLIALLAWASPHGPFVLVVTHPSSSPQSTLSLIGDAGGSFVSGSRASWIAVAHSDSPSFPARLRNAGALFVLNAGLLSLCHQERIP